MADFDNILGLIVMDNGTPGDDYTVSAVVIDPQGRVMDRFTEVFRTEEVVGGVIRARNMNGPKLHWLRVSSEAARGTRERFGVWLARWLTRARVVLDSHNQAETRFWHMAQQEAGSMEAVPTYYLHEVMEMAKVAKEAELDTFVGDLGAPTSITTAHAEYRAHVRALAAFKATQAAQGSLQAIA